MENFTNVPDSTPLRSHSLKPRCKISFWQELATSLSIRKCNLAQIQQRPALSPLVVSSLTPRLPMSYILPFCTFRSPTPPYPWKLSLSDRIYVYFFHVTYPWTNHVQATSGYKACILYMCVCFRHNFAMIHEYNRTLFIRALFICREISIFVIRLFV